MQDAGKSLFLVGEECYRVLVLLYNLLNFIIFWILEKIFEFSQILHFGFYTSKYENKKKIEIIQTK